MKVDKNNWVVFRDDVEIMFEDVSLDRPLVQEIALLIRIKGTNPDSYLSIELEDCVDLSLIDSIDFVGGLSSEENLNTAVILGISDALQDAASIAIDGVVTFSDEEQEKVNQNGDDLSVCLTLDFDRGQVKTQAVVSIKTLLPFVVCHKVDYSASK